jgi:hypothetical protein
MKIVLIYGKAGCGKTTYLANIIKKENASFVVLAYTHSAVENIYQRVQTVNHNLFHTFHSFFRIDFEKNVFAGATSIPDVIFIDEFSLITKELFKKILANLERNPNVKVYISGDPLQLNGIQDDNTITFKKLKKYYNNFGLIHPDILHHIYGSIFFNKVFDKAVRINLVTNYRANTKMNILLNDILNNKPPSIVCKQTVENKLRYEGYVLLAGTYKTLNMFNFPINSDAVEFKQKSNLFDMLYLSVDSKVIMIKTEKNRFYNGEELTVISTSPLVLTNSDNQELIFTDESDLPFTPQNLQTVHRAQGKTIPKIIVCLDDLFGVSMLYTAITRASEECLFYSIKHDKKLDNDNFNTLSSIVFS